MDQAIELWLRVVTPGRGAGESQWYVAWKTTCWDVRVYLHHSLTHYYYVTRWMRGLRQLEQTTERASRELDVRRSLREWDSNYPEIHHELIVRYLCGAVVSVATTSLYNAIFRPPRPSYYRR